MMNIPDAMILYLLLIANASLLAAAGIALVRYQKQFRRFERFWCSPTGATLADTRASHIPPLPQTSPQLERRVMELQSVVKTLAKKEQKPTATVEGSLPIENAVRMAKHGASIDELIRNCGLNIGEAKLMRKLHCNAHEADSKR